MPASKAAVAAGKQGKFWEMHDVIFENYKALNEELYVKTATELGLDVEKFKSDMNSPETAAFIQAEMKEAQKVGVRGTPTFFINGKKPQGRSFDLYLSNQAKLSRPQTKGGTALPAPSPLFSYRLTIRKG